MKRILKALTPVVSLAALAAAPVALAGYKAESAYCYKNTDGSGGCYGSLLGFRNHAGANTYAYFVQYYSGVKYFYANYTSGTTTTYFSCTPNTATGAQWTKALNHSGYFSVYWDASGMCNSLYLYNGSQYANF
ncbi:hypothetical protein JY651_14040 [Pyxidicoccus parkwayensis]|uniref:Peptidase inhibitor family I36 n=1 Tax=Pyxidicoccus parkwayensis TaxID=2813578 RepID=A0ABX7P657_9BACT|nr:hypothetical protein [Pyxidicoccus parkwaysis]QSQ25972.1 hypothetical protein JY651_14040 [Pyxidicoccus parkwaysis]